MELNEVVKLTNRYSPSSASQLAAVLGKIADGLKAKQASTAKEAQEALGEAKYTQARALLDNVDALQAGINELLEAAITCHAEGILDIDIDDLELSIRSYNCLKRAGIKTVQELISRNPEDLRGVRNLGQKSYEEILAKLEELGLEFVPSEGGWREKAIYKGI